MTADFDFWVEDDCIRVRFVSARALGRMKTGHATGGDYAARVIRLPRYETRRSQRTSAFHELGHYLCDRQELRARDTTEEEVCDLLTWVPIVLTDPRNSALRSFLGLA